MANQLQLAVYSTMSKSVLIFTGHKLQEHIDNIIGQLEHKTVCFHDDDDMEYVAEEMLTFTYNL